MYCLKCGNLLKKEDNFCSICGTPNNIEAKRISQGMSGYGAIRDDEPISLDDFFKTDAKTEQTFIKMDKELEDIKAKATENLLRRKNGDASARRAARLSRKAANGSARRDKQSYELNADLDFNDDVFQKSIEREALVGRRGQLKNKTVKPMDIHKEPMADFDEKISENPKIENANGWPEHHLDDIEKVVQSRQQNQPDIAELAQKPTKPKRHHLFREDTIEIPNIFDEIAESMQRSREQEQGQQTVLPEREIDDDIPLSWRGADDGLPEMVFSLPPREDPAEGMFPLPPKEDFAEGVFPLPPKEDFAEGVFPLPPKEDFAEGVFPLPPKEDFAGGVFPLPPKEDFAEGVFPLPPKEDFAEGVFPLPPKEDFAEGVFPLPNKPKANEKADVSWMPDSFEPPITGLTSDLSEEDQSRTWNMDANQDGIEPSYALRRPSRTQTGSMPKAAGEPEYEYFRYRSKKKKGPSPILVIIAVLIIIVTAVGTKMLYDGETPASVFHQLQDVFAHSEMQDIPETGTDENDLGNTDITDLSNEEGDEVPPSINTLKEEGASDPAKMLQYVKSRGINKNVQAIEYNPDLKYVTGTAYSSDDIRNAAPITDNLFYEKNNDKFYYTESIISAIVQYNSQWVDYFNDQNKAVFDLMKKGSKAYQDATSFLSNGAHAECVLLELGEMRKGKEGYYIWTRETYSITKGTTSKSEESQWIYYLEPSGENMKIVSYYNY